MRPTMTQQQDRTARVVRYATAFDQTEDVVSVDVPEDLSTVSDEELEQLSTAAHEAFDAVYGDGSAPTDEDVQTLDALATAIERVQAERTARSAQVEERQQAAAAVAARVRGEDPDGEGDGDEGDEGGGEEPSEPEPVEAEPVTAGAQPLSIRVRRPDPIDPPASPRSLALTAASGLGGGVGGGDTMNLDAAGRAISHKATSFPTVDQLRAASQSGRQMRGGFPIGSIERGIPSELMASSDTADEVMTRAADQSRLPGGSLVAAGGWCSPSETLYDLLPSLAGTDGLLSLPEFGVSRGGIRYFPETSFATVYAESGFAYTEAEDQEGDYDGEGGGVKPCFRVPCPEPTEVRLDVVGLCVEAGILQNRAFPELTSRIVSEALTAHQHRIDARTVASIIAGSDAVTALGGAGAAAPLLANIELQAEHFRNIHRMGRSETVEVVLPYWARGLIRADLSRRLGAELYRVTDAVITEHLNDRGVSPQWVYSLDPLTGAADEDDATMWRNTVSFLLYAAGTWTRGTSDVISLEAIYDSTLLGTNDFTALFTEEGTLVAKRRADSRYVTVPVCPDGATRSGIDISCQGEIVPDDDPVNN